MKKQFAFLFCSCLLFGQISAQQLTKDFELPKPGTLVTGSYYNAIEILDSRLDTTNFGIVQRGAFNRKARVIAKPSLHQQLQNILQPMLGGNGNHSMLIQLRQSNFAEIISGFSERGYCYLKIDLYDKQNLSFSKIAGIDTVIVMKSSIDVTNGILRNGGKTLVDFVTASLTKAGDNKTMFTLNDLENIDSIEKLTLPVYNTEHFVNGIYYSFNSFKTQTPDKKETLEIKEKENNITIKTVDSTGHSAKLKSKDVYAVVQNEEPFIATEFGFYRLAKRNNDFYFVGKAKVNPNTGDVIAAGIFFGLMGSLIANSADAVFEMKIDHTNGGFMRLREISTGVNQ